MLYESYKAHLIEVINNLVEETFQVGLSTYFGTNKETTRKEMLGVIIATYLKYNRCDIAEVFRSTLEDAYAINRDATVYEWEVIVTAWCDECNT